jgi:hypothetical protein
MRFKTLKGYERSININAYLIKWGEDSRSKSQAKVKDFFEPYWRGKVCCEEFPVAGSKMTLDIVNLTDRIAVEFQGKYHSAMSWVHQGSRNNYLTQIRHDISKEKWCILNNFTYVEIFPEDLPHLCHEWCVEHLNLHL